MLRTENTFADVYFNSQPHKEADNIDEQHIHKGDHFNSQPHKEADVNGHMADISMRAFQLTASQGG